MTDMPFHLRPWREGEREALRREWMLRYLAHPVEQRKAKVSAESDRRTTDATPEAAPHP
jgi:hypothetical protein